MENTESIGDFLSEEPKKAYDDDSNSHTSTSNSDLSTGDNTGTNDAKVSGLNDIEI